VVGIFAIAKTLSQNQRSAPVKLDGREQASVKVLNNNLLPFKKKLGRFVWTSCIRPADA
jgi:hypothetical protein